MEIESISRLTALSHPQRLAVFKLLVRRFPDEVPAGEIAHALDLKPNTASVYLSALRDTGMIKQRRQGTSLLYQANLDTAKSLIQYLFSNCCRDRVDLDIPAQNTPQVEETPDRSPLNVLFVCTGNSARSICAEVILRDAAAGMFHAYSAGSHPSSGPNPLVLEMLAAKGHDVDRLSSKEMALFYREAAPDMDVVITLCDRAANEECPIWAGHPLNTHWGLVDPVQTQGSLLQRRKAFENTYQILCEKIGKLITLDFQTLPRSHVQNVLDMIGRHQFGAVQT